MDLLAERPWIPSYPADVPADLPPPQHRSLPETLVAAAQEFATRTAFTTVLPNGFHGSLSYDEVDRLSDAFAVYLREELGLDAGSRIALQAPNCLSYPVVAFGVFKAGCVLVNTNPLYTAREVRHQLADAEVSAVVVIDLFADRVEGLRHELGDLPVVLLRIDEFFPRYVRGIVRMVQRWWNRVLPPVRYPAVRLSDALARGEQLSAREGLHARGYWEHLGPDDLAALQYTGGTTGVSKGAMLTHGTLLANGDQMLHMAAGHIRPGQETVLTALPLYHVFAFTVNLLGFYRRGAHDVLIPSPRPLTNLKRAFENHPVTWMSGVNTLFAGLLREEWFRLHPPPHLRASAAGGMALHADVAARWEELTGSAVVEGYGLTEASPVVAFNPLDSDAQGRPVSAGRTGTVGLPVPGAVVRCVDAVGAPVPAGTAGEVVVAGPQLMRGYWRRPEETAAVLRDGWLHTGDVGVMDSHGFLTIVDRTKDVVLVSGFNVFPTEVEEVLAAHPGVADAAIVGVPDDATGERVTAVVVRSDRTLTAEQLMAWARERLTGYKLPREVRFVVELPTSPIGKVLRKDVRTMLVPPPAQVPAPSSAPRSVRQTGEVG